MEKDYVWEFTNQKKLSKSEFIDYFERKIFRTIRAKKILPKDRIIKLKKSNSLNSNVLKEVLSKKFKVTTSDKEVISSDNLSIVAEQTMENILKGIFKSPSSKDKPLYYLSDKEIQLYAKLRGIKGKKRIENKKIKELFEKFTSKNPDLELNIIHATEKLNEKSL